MELLQEILCHVLADKKVQVSFSCLADTEIIKIAELECYKALQKIKAILEDDSQITGYLAMTQEDATVVPEEGNEEDNVYITVPSDTAAVSAPKPTWLSPSPIME